MTLDEAIKHCEEKAEELREQPFKEKMDIEDVASCEECAEEHEQLAEWLTKLDEARKIIWDTSLEDACKIMKLRNLIDCDLGKEGRE